jgi:hypothetical protein
MTTPNENELIYFNGIDATTGNPLVNNTNLETGTPLVGAMSYAAATKLITGQTRDTEKESWLRRIWRVIGEIHLGLPFDVTPEKVEQAGWGIVFHHQEDQKVKDALQPLIDHRKQQINKDAIVKVLEYRTGDDRATWLARHGVGAGSIIPEKVPYYLLFVGGPEKIPFSFCHQIDVEYALGILHFDSPEEYSRYAQSVINYETEAKVPNAKEMTYFATRHNFDRATQMSADLLVKPLADGAPGSSSPEGIAKRMGFRSRKYWGDDAKKSNLGEVLKPPANTLPPALLFTASHGMGYPKGHADQLAGQGALLCQDWPAYGNISPAHYFSADDLPNDAKVQGLIAFFFACYGAGTPTRDRFLHNPGTAPPDIAAKPFLASLPKKLLAHPNGGALACIGHVERAWGYSIVTPNAGAQLLPFENAIGRILLGQPIGHAMKDFNERYAALSTSLASLLEEKSFGSPVSSFELTSAWIGRNDAEGYVIIGDPAIKMRVNDLAES